MLQDDGIHFSSVDERDDRPAIRRLLRDSRMTRIPRFDQKSLYTIRRRAGVMLGRFWQNRFIRAKHARLVKLNGRPYKRLTLSDASVATGVARNLEKFRHHHIFPELVAVIDNELLLEFVVGRSLQGEIDASLVDRLASFFAILYSVDRRRVPTTETPFGDDLRRDLAFLRDVGVLEAAAYRDLAAAAEGLSPPEIWVGYDYVDPLPRNFVATHEGRLVAVDVEDLLPDQLIGSGVAKACFRSIGPHRARLLAALERDSFLGLEPMMPFVELHFLASWTKRAYLKGRAKLVDPARFEPYREQRGGGAA